MFNHIQLEVYNLYSYNFSFLNTFNDTLIHLIHWQYWWWFWFTFLLTLYYIFFMRFFFFRSLKFNPKIVTSYRSHGKWGDLIICILPVSWCLNILSNSTTLLKILEWQSESNFFTLRVRGKQWYWVYKFDFKSLIENLYTSKIHKNVGHISFLNNNSTYNKNNFYILFNSFLKTKNSSTFEDKLPETIKTKNILSLNNYKKINFLSYFITEKINKIFFNFDVLSVQPTLNSDLLLQNIKIYENFLNIFKGSHLDFFNDFSLNRYNRDIFFYKNSLELLKSKEFIFFNNNFDLLKFKVSNNNIKMFNNNFYIVLKQKPISDWSKFENSSFYYSGYSYEDYSTYYSDSFIFNDSEKIQYYNNMRLLRLNKMLFLPTNLQINVITNSFDVIHSWFIPGLGLKMDCVPGRSTHHTLYIDVPGIYYGQCAEICGRFHHHMPIRICALELEHYLLWFNHYVLSSFIDFDTDKQNTKFISNLKKMF